MYEYDKLADVLRDLVCDPEADRNQKTNVRVWYQGGSGRKTMTLQQIADLTTNPQVVMIELL